MKLLFDEDLVEGVVFLCATGKWAGVPALQIRRFHGERERLYRILDSDDRNAAFFQLHLEWFREWRAEHFLAERVAQFPLLESELDGMGFRKARTKQEEGAELFVSNETGRRAVVALRAERFADPAALERFLNHELMHIRDMVDPDFGYSPEVRLGGPATSQQRLVRERYRVLWDVTIDGRLAAANRKTDCSRDRRCTEFERVYSFWPEEKRNQVFMSLWNDGAPRHDRLMALASDPRDLQSAQQPLPGSSCPLCGFPTFEWASGPQIAPHLALAVRAEFPGWEEHHGACGRCIETYEAVLGNAPAAV